ncbi:hypothetical protein GDO86_012276 [Hymenochirus boettgeri]|uniref:Uncharacterized protein n=1 Tax=Hymenochirus boettgeri TaxID=247094 RepID=A0A8T2IPD5_9PIPI|nr:hypothetical protein GDO86_012276 [Hymenochirus boettgeri]
MQSERLLDYFFKEIGQTVLHANNLFKIAVHFQKPEPKDKRSASNKLHPGSLCFASKQQYSFHFDSKTRIKRGKLEK